MALLPSIASSHLWVPSAEGFSNWTCGTRTSACACSLVRSALPRSVICSKSVTCRWWIHFITWCARKRFSPSVPAKKSSSPVRSRSSRFCLEAVSVTGLQVGNCHGPARRRADPWPGGSTCVHVRGREEVRELDGGGLGGVGAVDGIGVDRVGEVGADGAGGRFLRVGGAHELAVLQHRALAFQRLHHHRAGDHELDQRVEERALAVHGVEAFGLGLGQVLHLRGNDLQAGLLETG